jgi:DNA segregation ATPase FtsK/SpoIIIE, S-DNA-T family
MPDENLPAIPDTAVEEAVYDGEIVDETAAAGSPGSAAARRRAVLSPHAVLMLRHAGYVLAGVVVLARRWQHRRNFHIRMSEAAAAGGDHETSLKWAQQHAVVRHNRHDRAVEKVNAAVNVVKVLPVIAMAWLILMGATGVLLAIARRNPHDVWWPWQALAHATGLAVSVASVLAFGALFAVPLAVVAVLYHHGRNPGTFAPAWMATAADPFADVTITEVTITKALADMRFPTVTKYLDQGIPLQFLVPCRQEGRGTFARLRLPGVAAEKIVRRRSDFAAGLYRLPKEVWPSTGSEAAILDVWIADKGALAEGAGPYPLLEEGFTDVFRGLPFGRILRGDPSRIPVVGRNTMCGGMPDQGKSNGARVVACGYALDITTELRIYIPDVNFDFEPFAPRCSRYVMGAEDEFIERIQCELEELKDEVQQRGQLLVDYEQQEVTRELANAGAGLHPVFVLLEEAHVAIQHRKYGKDISQLLCDIVKLDRKRAIHLMLSTQAPVRGSMPSDVTQNCTNGIAFAVGDIWANDALLGAGAYSAGHRATELIPGTDRGTALCKGFSGERSEVVQVHRIDTSSDNDQVTPIVGRALAEMQRRGRALPGSNRPLAIEARDLLTDLAEVMRDEGAPVRVADLPARLRRLAPAFGGYRQMTGVQLRDQLGMLRVRTTNTGNVPRLDRADLEDALARRGELGGFGVADLGPEAAFGGVG